MQTKALLGFARRVSLPFWHTLRGRTRATGGASLHNERQGMPPPLRLRHTQLQTRCRKCIDCGKGSGKGDNDGSEGGYDGFDGYDDRESNCYDGGKDNYYDDGKGSEGKGSGSQRFPRR